MLRLRSSLRRTAMRRYDGSFAVLAGRLRCADCSQLTSGQIGDIAPGSAEPHAQQSPIPGLHRGIKTVNADLADGTTITRESTEVRAVDSQQRSLNPGTISLPGRSTDNVAERRLSRWTNTTSSWNSQTKQATVIKLPPLAERHGCWASDSGHFSIEAAKGDNHAASALRQGLSVCRGQGRVVA